DAVVRKGTVRVTAVDCAFGPHLAAFRLLQSGGDDAGLLTVRHCSVLGARRSAVFDVGARARAAADAAHCLFARVGAARGDPGAEGDSAVLLRQGDGDAVVSYKGHDNRYYNLDGYWAVGDAWRQAGWRDFRRRVREAKGDDSRVLLSSPWKFGPKRQL